MFTVADLVLARCCLSERVFLCLRLCLLIITTTILYLSYQNQVVTNNNAPYCLFIIFSTWSCLFTILYFLCTMFLHFKYRTLVRRHFEYHESLLELSSDAGLASSEKIGRIERIQVTLYSLSLISNIVNLLSLATDSPLPSLFPAHLQFSLLATVAVAVDTLFNRYTLRASVLFESGLLGILYCCCTFLVNYTHNCDAFLFANMTATMNTGSNNNSNNSTTWYALHVFQDTGVGSTRFVHEMPFIFFFSTLLLTSMICCTFTFCRFRCVGKEKDKIDHTSKIMMCALG